VQLAGVLMVFVFLIVPAVMAALFFQKLSSRLLMSWALGAGVSAIGVTASYLIDLPTGATVVTSFGVALVLSLLARGCLVWAGWLTQAPAED
jgi:zinc/manganese transport system permease protein